MDSLLAEQSNSFESSKSGNRGRSKTLKKGSWRNLNKTLDTEVFKKLGDSPVPQAGHDSSNSRRQTIVGLNQGDSLNESSSNQLKLNDKIKKNHTQKFQSPNVRNNGGFKQA